ncbi:Glutathione S-transferase-like protein ustS [Psilocybe cubensis]|uniref:Glutathione S-transferase-like protein ustS n=1 Tax=Psilocybe cubensis TaxID=181762 RepID=A0ACB8GI41_PSICU|nr:Glutathione S-transferase-like protein ustS [Psilocybe cubensis]KAH9475228.1 Glutathione S-transferase-like protein ustS [Psilocybe cubensis]
MTITFYDIPSTTPECAWSPNTWKIRYALNYRNIPYKTEWIEYPDIKEHCIKHGIKPTGKTRFTNGPEVIERDYYSLPAIYDPKTNTYLADSLRIVEYLEHAYPPSPSSPSLFPNNTHALQVAFTTAYNVTTRDDGVADFIVPAVYTKLNVASQPYFRRTREERFGKRLEDVFPKPGSEEDKAGWSKFKEVTGILDGWYAKTDIFGEDSEGKTVAERRTPFLMGDTLSWGDLVIAGYTIWLRIIWGEDSDKWQDMMTWHGGRWKTLMANLKKYETVL